MEIIKKHIVFLTPGFPENETDTTCIPALQIYAKNLGKIKNIKISVVTLHYPFLTTSYQWHTISVYSLGFKNQFSLFKKKRVLDTLTKIHRQDTITTIHSFWLGECAYFGHVFSEKHNINHIVTLMGQEVKKKNRFVFKLPLQKMKIISLSSFQQKLFFDNYKKHTNIIQWGIDENQVQPFSKKTIDIIGIGSLIKLKNYLLFIETIALIKNHFPNIKVVLIGDGSEKEEIIKQAEKLNVRDLIEFKGKMDYHKTQQVLSQSKILLHPSNYESFGMVFAEALAHNTYIVSQQTGLAQETEYWKTGNTSNMLAQACSDFLERKSLPTFPVINVRTTINQYLKIYT